MSQLPYDERPTDDPLVQAALASCPWKNTDHLANPDAYCTWCEGYVTGVLDHKGRGTGYVDPIAYLAYKGKDDCDSPVCTRLSSGHCVGWHCANCDEPSSHQGHFGEGGFSCRASE